MIIIKSASYLSNFLAKHNSGKKIGFVPTMGALHEGHISLIQRAKEDNDITVCSIFINPAQFNNHSDFIKYPITIEQDIELLIAASCDLLFMPSLSEIYPEGYKKKYYSLGKIESLWEGHYRPGHFQGVCQVVERLLEIVIPQRIYLGQKDYQQCMVIKKLIEILQKENQHEIVICPTIREVNGLAMSSRNLRLTEGEKEKAAGIYNALVFLRHNINKTHEEIKCTAIDALQANGFLVDYVAIADALTLEPPDTSFPKLIGMIAATINDVRLIDNMLLN